MDREELLFNRAERSWDYRAAKGVDITVTFGSTRAVRPTGSVMFVNCAYPMLGEDAAPPKKLVFATDAQLPCETSAFLNVSGMS